jgi:general secretion pathway protein A
MYDQFYGFTGRPFQLTPDPQFYFESGTHRKALSYLGYGLAQGEGFIVITGEVGSGKSTLVAHLMQTIDRTRLTAATIVTSQLDGHDLVNMAAECFGISAKGLDKTGALRAIESHLHAEARAGRRCLLIVDEAQNLSIDALEELRMLSNFQLGATALLQIFLLGQPEFRNMMQQSAELEQLRQRVIATHHLDAMDANEVKPYIEHRLRCVGWTGNPQIGEDVCAIVFRETSGVPRKINTLLSRVLLMGAVEQVNLIEPALVEAVVADIAGKPFDYKAPEQAHIEAAPALPEFVPAPTVDVVEEPAIETPNPTLAEFDEKEFTSNETDAADRRSARSDRRLLEDAFDGGERRNAESDRRAMEAANVAANINNTELMDRIQTLENRVADQDVSLRRVLHLLIDWMDKENNSTVTSLHGNRAA